MANTILLVFAFVFFCLGAFWGPYGTGTPWYGRFNLVSAGLACWTLSLLLAGGHLH